MNIINGKRVWGGLLALCLIGSAATAQQANKSVQKPVQIGQFRLNTRGGSMDGVWNTKTKTISWDVRGGGGKSATITTARYDMSAPRITLLQDYGRRVVVTGNATGGVHIVVRQQDMNTIADCDTAVYHEAKGADNPARIDMQGNVKIVNRSPRFTSDDPFVVHAETAYIKFIDADNIAIHTDNTEAGGTPIEPETKNGKPQ